MYGPACCHQCGSETYVGMRNGKIREKSYFVKIVVEKTRWCEHHSGAIIDTSYDKGWFCSSDCMVSYVLENENELRNDY